MVIGTAKGPGETPNSYTFVTPDTGRAVKTGEFVYYEAEADGAVRQILGRVTKRIPLRLYPDAFLADPEVDPTQVAALVGYTDEECELFEVHVTIMGYYDDELKAFVNPRIPPRIGWKVYLADNELLVRVLNRRRFVFSEKQPEAGGAYIGSLLSRPPFDPEQPEAGGVPIVIDVKEIAATHMAIIAGTGAGKSYLASVIVEEMLKPTNRAAILIVDPHGEYGTLAKLQEHPAFRYDDRHQAQVLIKEPQDVKIRVSELTHADLRYLLSAQFGLSAPMEYMLGNVLDELRNAREGKTPWTKEDLYRSLDARRDSGPHQEEEAVAGDSDPALAFLDESGRRRGSSRRRTDSDDIGAGTIRALRWRLSSLFREAPNFDNVQHLDLHKLFQPGQCTVLQLSEIDRRQQQVIVAVLLRMAWKARLNAVKGQGNPADRLPYPVFILIEEAHHFAPANEDVVTTNILKTILAEGRKFGIGVGLISQRPGKLDSDVLSQCMTQFLLRIVNEYDQSSVAAAVESASHDLLQELPALSKGQAIVAGAAVNTPLAIRVRRRLTPHGGIEPDAPAEWRKFFTPQEEQRRAADTALPPDSSLRGRSRLFKSSESR